MQFLYKTIYYTLAAGALTLGVLLVLLQTNYLPNYEVRIVQSGSMEPALKTGSVVVIRAQENYAIGDIVTFGGDQPNSLPTTHRIIADEVQNGQLAYITKGDANDSVDQNATRLTSVRGKVVFNIPYLGYLLDFARQPLGFVLLIGIPAALIVFEEVGSIWGSVRKREAVDDTTEKT